MCGLRALFRGIVLCGFLVLLKFWLFVFSCALCGLAPTDVFHTSTPMRFHVYRLRVSAVVLRRATLGIAQICIPEPNAFTDPKPMATSLHAIPKKFFLRIHELKTSLMFIGIPRKRLASLRVSWALRHLWLRLWNSSTIICWMDRKVFFKDWRRCT